MQTDNGYFRDFLGYSKAPSPEERGSEDAFGRTLMALGFLVNEGPSHLLMKYRARYIFGKPISMSINWFPCGGMANAIIGVCQVIKYNYPDDLKQDMVVGLSNKLVALYNVRTKRRIGIGSNLPWLTRTRSFPLLYWNAYDRITQDEAYLHIAFESMRFLESKALHNAMDIMAMILFCQQAFRVTREQEYLDRMYKHYQWFLGANDSGPVLI